MAWLKQRQNTDGGWGESNDSYAQPARSTRSVGSTPYQTAWALLGLLSAGEAASGCVRRGAEFLLRTRQAGRIVERSQFHGAWFSARVLSALPRLLGIFPVVGAGRLSDSDAPRNRSLNWRRRGAVPPRRAHSGTIDAAGRTQILRRIALRSGHLLAVSGIGPPRPQLLRAALVEARSLGAHDLRLGRRPRSCSACAAPSCCRAN